MRRFYALFLTFSTLCADILVTNNNNYGPGSLRQALLDVTPLNNTIDIMSGLPPIIIGSDTELPTALPVLTGITINGNGNTISGDGKFPIFVVLSGTNNINDLLLMNGMGQGGKGGDGAGGGGGGMGAGGALFYLPLCNGQSFECEFFGE